LDTRQEEVAAANARGLFHGVAPPPPVNPAPAHHAMIKTVPPPIPASTGVSVEVYQGDKKPEVVKCTEDNCDAK